MISVLLVFILSAAVLAGCSSHRPEQQNPPIDGEAGATAPPEGDRMVKIGLGHITSIAKSSDLDADSGIAPTGQREGIILSFIFLVKGDVLHYH